jgi:hypothetical protein
VSRFSNAQLSSAAGLKGYLARPAALTATATSGIRGRLDSHKRSKGDLWTHFSAFEVWDNIRDEEIVELEGLFRHFYRKDTSANKLNVQRRFKKLSKVRQNNLSTWK